MKKIEITVQGFPIAIDKHDYICLTDMAKAGAGKSRAADIIKNWINTQSTIDFLGTWESINSTIFNVVGFHHVKNLMAEGSVISVKSWVAETDAAGIYAKEGKYGGTYAHKDIAFEFGAAISPAFKLYLIKEFQRLKEIENNSGNIEWNVRRLLSKAHYHIQTDAVKNYKIPQLHIPEDKAYIAYAEEGDILNLSMFHFTSKQWREANIELAARGSNVRDFASINELAVLANLEGINAEMIKANIPFSERLNKLRQISEEQLKTLERISPQNTLRKTIDGQFTPKELGMFPTTGLT